MAIACSDSERVRLHAQRDQRGLPGGEGLPGAAPPRRREPRLELGSSSGAAGATVATASLLDDGTIEITGEPTNVEFLADFRVHDATADRWVTKEENPELWFDQMPALSRRRTAGSSRSPD